MVAVIESFEHTDMRKSARIPLCARATLRGIPLDVSDWSFEGFRVADILEAGRIEVDQTVEVAFMLHNATLRFAFKHQARKVWSTDTQAGFAWILIPTHVRSMLCQYLATQHSRILLEPSKYVPSASPMNIAAIDGGMMTEPAVRHHKKRKSRLAGYAIASVLLLMAIGTLAYENQFVFSTRALYPGNLAEVVAAADGMIEKVLVNRGDYVKAGDIVATLNTLDLDTHISAMAVLLKERMAAVDVARSAVTDTSTPLSMYSTVASQQLAVAQAKAAEARATMNGRTSDLNRMLELDRSGLIGKSAIDHARAEAESATGHYQASTEEEILAERVAKEAKDGRFFNGNKVDNDLQLARVGLAQRQADLAQAELDMSRLVALRRNSNVYAKTSGQVFSVERPIGHYIKSGESLIVLSGDGLPIVTAKFDVKDAERLQPGAAATVYLNGGSQSIAARISQIGHTRIPHNHPFAPLIESPPDQITVEFELDSVPEALTPGMPVEIKVSAGGLLTLGTLFTSGA